ncbi:interleukin-1 receptor-associated kinase 1-binding protein 1 homolog [Periophthalmus magnuspinnatus]|uniref:interleukin-1 receptor-associated kinase 1-binding protein 1 homolog n=1 Tax=Periophthalmus magnuspinnatus TaxID=409849 RepID=UPI0024364730|nr:interleukin-1 receptor-associated kinase 1-binding protein 1 homolog [Periophthalmus magnuspinnatus]
MDPQTRVFATVLPTPDSGMKDKRLETDRRTPHVPPRPRELQVTGTAELCAPADRASVRVCVSSSKESVNEATNSVSRRLDYILQCVRTHGINTEDVLTRTFLHREEEQYHMNAEVAVTFSDFAKMELVCRLLLEKLDKSVIIGLPRYFHSPECLSQLRRRVCASAVDNAKQKASDISQLLGQTLGSPQLIVEEEIREVHSEDDGSEHRPLTALPCIPSITAFSRVSITFGIKDRIGKQL